jgi:transcriptional regulator with XRE-family HTH domain
MTTSNSPFQRRYPPEMRDRAVRMRMVRVAIAERGEQNPSYDTLLELAQKLVLELVLDITPGSMAGRWFTPRAVSRRCRRRHPDGRRHASRLRRAPCRAWEHPGNSS